MGFTLTEGYGSDRSWGGGEKMIQGQENRAVTISCCVLIRANEVELASWLGLFREVVWKHCSRLRKYLIG